MFDIQGAEFEVNCRTYKGFYWKKKIFLQIALQKIKLHAKKQTHQPNNKNTQDTPQTYLVQTE